MAPEVCRYIDVPKKIFLLDHFLSLFDTVAHPIAVTEASGEILYANTEFEEMTTLGVEIIRGMCIDNLFPPEHKRKIAASLSIASNQDNDFVMREHKIYIRRKSRRLVPVDLSMSKPYSVKNLNWENTKANE